MIEKLFEQGYLNVELLVLNNYKKLDLNEIDAIVLIKVLDLCKRNKSIRASKLSNELNISKRIVEDSLNNLLAKNLYSIDVIVNERGLNDEKMSLSPFFEKISLLFKEEEKNVMDDEIGSVVSIIEGEVSRPLSAQEFSVIEGWIVSDGFTSDEIKSAIKESVKLGKVNLSIIEKKIIQNRKVGTNVKKSDPNMISALKGVLSFMDEKN